jgi:hypothetical protein
MRSAGFVAGCDDLYAEPMQRGIETKIGSVNDAEDFLNAFLLQHAGDDFAATDLCHGSSYELLIECFPRRDR